MLQSTLIFLHIPKAAGSTLREILIGAYGRDRTYVVDTHEAYIEYIEKTDEEKLQYPLVVGHTYYGIHRHIPGRYQYVTLLRHPIARVLSDYHFKRRTPDNYLYSRINGEGMDLIDYVESGVEPLTDNGQLRLLYGDIYREHVPFGQSHEDMLETVKERIREEFLLAGICESFDRSTALLAKYLGQPLPKVGPLNSAPTPTGMHQLTASEYQILERYNRLDAALYEYVRELFEQQWATRSGTAGPAPVTHFSRAMQPFMRLGSALVKGIIRRS